MIVQQEAGITSTIFESGAAAWSAPSTCRTFTAGPQPAQAACPGRSSFSSATISSIQAGIATPHPLGHVDRLHRALCKRPAQRRRRHLGAAEPTDHVRDAGRLPEPERADVAAERPERAERRRPVDHRDVAGVCEHRGQLGGREGPVGVDTDDQQVVLVLEQLLRGLADRPDRHQRTCGTAVADQLERARPSRARSARRTPTPRSSITSRASSIAAATFRWNA